MTNYKVTVIDAMAGSHCVKKKAGIKNCDERGRLVSVLKGNSVTKRGRFTI